MNMFSIPLFCQNDSEQYTTIIKKINAEKYNDADILVDQWLAHEPENDTAIILKCRIIDYRVGRKESNDYITEKVKSLPHFNIIMNAATSLSHSGRADDAEYYLDLADSVAETKEEKRTVYFNRAFNYMYLEKFDTAIKMHQNMIIDSPTCTACYNNLFIVYFTFHQYDECVKAMKNALRFDSSSADILNNIGLALSTKGSYEEAIQYLDRSIQIDPNNAYAYSNRSFCKLNMGFHTEAIKDVNRSIALNGRNSYAYRNRALVYLALNLKEEACKDFFAARDLGFRKFYGTEINELIEKHCKQKE